MDVVCHDQSDDTVDILVSTTRQIKPDQPTNLRVRRNPQKVWSKPRIKRQRTLLPQDLQRTIYHTPILRRSALIRSPLQSRLDQIEGQTEHRGEEPRYGRSD